MANPRLTIPKYAAVDGVPAAGISPDPGKGRFPLVEETPLEVGSLRTPVWRKSPRTIRPDGEIHRWFDGRLRSSDSPVGGAGKLVLALAPLSDRAAPS
ncbi:hypothetical protein U1Q18_010629 [Sarracenia purpurea var. burkii]